MRIRVAAVLAMITAALAVPAAFQARGVVPLEAADCERLNMMFGDFTVGRAMQHTKVPLSVGMLEVRPPGNGGVQIEKGAGREYSITACVAAGASDKAEAQRLADAVRLVIKGNRVAVENLGQPARSWNVQLVVEVPGRRIGRCRDHQRSDKHQRRVGQVHRSRRQRADCRRGCRWAGHRPCVEWSDKREWQPRRHRCRHDERADFHSPQGEPLGWESRSARQQRTAAGDGAVRLSVRRGDFLPGWIAVGLPRGRVPRRR